VEGNATRAEEGHAQVREGRRVVGGSTLSHLATPEKKEKRRRTASETIKKSSSEWIPRNGFLFIVCV